MAQRYGFIVLTLVGLWSGVIVHADDEPVNQNKVQLDDSTGKKPNVLPGAEAIDEIITNNNLRAFSGSTSLWSIASIFNYNGGTILTPLSQDRPDISQASGTTTKSDLDGSISAKYNLSVKDSVMAGLGVRWIAPLSLSGPSNYNGTTFDAMNPYLQYQHIYKWSGIQSVFQVQDMQWTQTDQTALGYFNQLSLDQENMYEIGKSKISIGVSAWAQYQWFNKSGSFGNPSDSSYIPDLAAVQSVYAFGFSPELEYQLTPKINLRTLVSLLTFEHYGAASNSTDLIHDKIYESVGIGYSVTRDIFLYPNVQFLPNQMDSQLTNIGLQATINVF